MTTKPPEWCRLDCDFFEDPRISWLHDDGQHAAVALAIQGITYATRFLTDGWIPRPMPKRWGYRPAAVAALENVGAWTPYGEGSSLPGWLITGYLDRNPSRSEWERLVQQRRSAAFARWANR